jgi:hypothetical protein
MKQMSKQKAQKHIEKARKELDNAKKEVRKIEEYEPVEASTHGDPVVTLK